jgi:phosphotransferase system  glucose/maltose/N-acetylglucosamine-specific IIC component
VGLGGIIYTIAVWRRVRVVTTYTMVFEDWAWHVILPLVAYAVTLVSALAVEHETVLAMFLIGSGSLLLLFIGIHNAWDTVTHLPLQRIQREQEKPGK